ncbi:MAG TPA: carboxypeptidase regulatory-like domain-containing protein [Gemmatimonadales bacterium]
MLIRGAFLAWLVLGLAAPARAQRVGADTVPRGAVLGTVLDAGTGRPLRAAVVLLEPLPGGAVAPAADRSGFWSTGVTTTSDYRGQYAFMRVPAGAYRLVVRRLGYRPSVLQVELRQAVPMRVSVGLVVQPILLEAEVVTAPAVLFTSAASHSTDYGMARLDAERMRQHAFVGGDVHLLTQRDIVDAVTLGETDLMRALQRLPGVTTRDDFTAELWTRGAPGSHSRVYFDGMPLFNPLHTGGVFTAVSPDAVGAAFFHTGVRSAAMGEGAAGVLDITSRPGSGPGVNGAGELSVVSGRLALDGGLGEHGGWMVAARRSYADLVYAVVADSADRIPYAFLDVAARTDVSLGGAATLELSGLWQRDEVRGSVRDILRSNRGYWGNGASRITLAAPVGELYTRSTVGVSRYDGHLGVIGLYRDAAAAEGDFRVLAVTHEPTDNEITFVTVRTRVEPIAGARSWAAGIEFNVQDQRYEGPTPRPYPVVALTDSIAFAARRLWSAVWLERRWAGGPVTLEVGVRGEFSGGAANTPAAALAPRLTGRVAATDRSAFTAGLGRSYQYNQAVAPAGPAVGPALHLTEAWFMVNDSLPAARADMATIGAETWIGQTWLGSANLYARRVTGVVVPPPGAGPASPSRPLYVAATNDARGLELSLRRLAGRVTGAISYSYGSSRMRVDTLRFASPNERRHVIDLTGMVRVSPSLRMGAAVAAAGGAPFTRFFLERVPCDTLAFVCPDTVLLNTTRLEAPSQGRSPAYVSVDLLADWSHAFRRWSLGVFLQLRNAINRRGAVTYAGSYEACSGVDVAHANVPRPGVCDVFERGLPILPLLGVSVRF